MDGLAADAALAHPAVTVLDDHDTRDTTPLPAMIGAEYCNITPNAVANGDPVGAAVIVDSAQGSSPRGMEWMKKALHLDEKENDGSADRKTGGDVSGLGGPVRAFLRGVAVSTAGNSQAFGYSITITATYGAVSAVHGSPTPAQLIAFALLGVAAFSLLNLTVVRALPHDENDSERRRVLLVATATDVLAVGAAVGTAIALAHALPAWPAWVVAPFLGSVIYVLVQAIELAVGRAHDKQP